ncbi:molybdopterin-synthase adenylyltransferase MoeB [Alphaproteobacteria bacterium]|jgi:adenylyltransferase/sulfurtransferase|nr:molybdopterin-synthase adenylyltransferase MoeB [Alphaproteobacteria bacterium]
MTLDTEQKTRYARHIALEEVGEEGQAALLNARVLVVGAGGLGSPVLLYLAAGGVGTLGIVDFDTVDLSNLQRQIVHGEETIGEPKVKSAAERLADLNPDIIIETHRTRFAPENARDLVGQYDLIVDGSDNFTTRYLLNDACYFAGKPLVAAALLRFEGQLSTFKPYLTGENHPCYRCLFPSPPAPGFVPRCEQAGIFGAVAGVMGTLQATETIKEILGLGESLSGKLVLYDGLSARFISLTVKRDPDCPLCGDSPTIISLNPEEGP